MFDGTQTGNANRVKLYIDGAQVSLTFNTGTADATLTNATDPVEFGHMNGSPSGGAVDDARIYNRALSAAR